MPDSHPSPSLTVTSAEAGQKLLQFLIRRLALPSSLLHRWIRTGQIRINGARCKAFQRLEQNDSVRLPPFAQRMAASAGSAPASTAIPPLPPLLRKMPDLLIFNKPAGLPTHGGSGQSDSLAARLASHFPDTPFRPTPAHRLDKDTSGLLLVAASYAMLRHIQDALRQRQLHKEYLCWVDGRWPHDTPVRLEHRLMKQYTGWYENVHTGDGKEAACIVAPLRCLTARSLLHIRLLSGRTHQIRAQLAACGFPLMGDHKYGSTSPGPLHLHALRIVLPDGSTFSLLPPWKGALAVSDMPGILTSDAPLLRPDI